MKITLLYGTETGNAAMVCDDIEDEFSGEHDCEVVSLGDISPSDMSPDIFYIIVCSTYGNGDLPGSAVAFGDALTAQSPDLSGVRFAMFGLGDMVFDETFNLGSKKLAEMLKGCRAEMVGERGIHDASSAEPPEDIAIGWARDRVAQAASVDA